MRISDSTVIYENKNDKYLINFPAGSIDKIGTLLVEQIKDLQEQVTFEPSVAPFSAKTLDYLNEQKYITSLSPWEEKRENERMEEKRRARAKIQPKRRSIVLNPEIGNAWCSFKETTDQKTKELGDRGSREDPIPILEKILDKLEKSDSSKIDIWLNLEKRENDWEEVYSLLGEKGLKVEKVWSVVKSEKKSYFKDWARDHLFPEEVSLYLKTLNSRWGKYYEVPTSGEVAERNLWSERLTSLFKKGVAYFTCPFLYNSVFISEGSITHCAEEVQGKGDSQENGVLEREGFGEDFSTNSSGKNQDFPLNSIQDFTCPKLTEKFKTHEDYYQAFYQRILDRTINQLSLTRLRKEDDISKFL